MEENSLEVPKETPAIPVSVVVKRSRKGLGLVLLAYIGASVTVGVLNPNIRIIAGIVSPLSPFDFLVLSLT